MSRRATKGFTLVELMLSIGLSVVVGLGLTYILTPVARGLSRSSRSRMLHVNAASVGGVVRRELLGASLLNKPALIGMPSESLEGCSNAGGVPPAPLDFAVPMRWFAVCSVGVTAHYHAGSGCPGSYVCGQSSTASFSFAPAPGLQLTFIRPHNSSTALTANLAASVNGITVTVSDTVLYPSPAGGAQ